MRKLFSLSLLSIFIFCNTPKDKNRSINFLRIKDSYNLNVHYKYSKKIFPKPWLEAPISGYGTQIDFSEAKRMEAIINDSFSRYSKEFINSNLTDIYLLKEMYFYNKPFGGTSSEKGIYICNDGGTYDNLLALMHSEFSSILYRNYQSLFPVKEWNKINKPNFKYVGSGVSLLGQKNLDEQTEELLSNGFLVKYSTSSMEQDFNMFVRWIFTKPNELQKIANRHNKIKNKYNLVIDFYNEINSKVEF